MRKLNSKKGGRIMVLKNNNTQIQMEESFELHDDCLVLNFKIKGMTFI